ncbi:MAG: hypothetical protein ACTSYR_03995 [Candidatus Odinarchaeia archaeon]
MKVTVNSKEYEVNNNVADLLMFVSRERDTYKDALEKLSKLGNGSARGNSDGNIIAQKALDSFV